MPDKTPSILLAGIAVGVAATVLNLVPVVGSCLACLAYIGAGLLAVWHYTDRHRITLKGGQGAGIGALAGLVAMVTASLLQFVFMMIGVQPSLREMVSDQLDMSGLDPAQVEQIMNMVESPFFIVGILLVATVIYAILGAIGGAIGASLFKRGGDALDGSRGL